MSKRHKFLRNTSVCNRWLFVLFFLFIGLTEAIAQTTMVAGDMAVIRYNEDDGVDGFSVVSLVNLQSGTKFSVTEEGWRGSYGWANNSEVHAELITNTAYAAGTVFHFDRNGNSLDVRINNDATVKYNLSTGNSGLNYAGGDQAIIYQGTKASPVFITGLNSTDHGELATYNKGTSDATTKWASENSAFLSTELSGGQVSRIPQGLTNGVNAISLFYLGTLENPATQQNAYYSGMLSGTKTQLSTAINNRGNWTFPNAEATRANVGAVATGTLTVTGGGVALSTSPTLTFSNATGFTKSATDGTGGSVNISDIDLEIYAISDAAGTKSNVYNVGYNGADYPPIIVNGTENNSLFGWAIKSAAGARFSLDALDFLDVGSWKKLSYKLEAFKGGASQGIFTFTGNDENSSNPDAYIPLSRTSGTSTLKIPAYFTDVDEVRIYKSYAQGAYTGLNNIKVSTPSAVLPVPTTTGNAVLFSADNGLSGTDLVTNIAAQTVSGTLTANLMAGERVEVSLDNGNSYTTAIALVGSNAWSLAGITLAGSNNLKVRVANSTGAGAPFSTAYVLDTTTPTVSITSSTGSLSTGQTATITLNFSETPGDFTLSDLVAVTGEVSNLAATANPLVYTAIFTPNASTSGIGIVSLMAGSYIDVAGNAGAGASIPAISINTIVATLPADGLAFNGTNQYAEVPARSALDFTTGTVEMWVKPGWTAGAYNDVNPCIAAMRNTSTTRWSFHINRDLGSIGLWNSSQYMSRNFTFVKNQWYHVSFVMTGSNTEIFINGTSIGLTGNTMRSASTGLTFKLAQSEAGSPEIFQGEIDEVRIWNTARTATEIANNRSVPVATNSTGLIGYYKIDADILASTNQENYALKDYSAAVATGKIYNYFAPTVTTGTASAITSTGFTGGGEVTSNGGGAITARGLVYSSTNATPTILDGKTNIGTGDGTFSGTVAGLSDNIAYKVRAFATNANSTGYGPVVIVTTLSAGPAVTSVGVPANKTYILGETLNFTVNFSTAVDVTGSPSIAVTIGSTLVNATYISGSGTDALVFSYTLSSGQLDTDGISIGALSLNDGTIKNGTTDAILTLNNVGNTTNVKVNAQQPTVVSVNRVSSTPTNSASLYYNVTFSEAVSGVGATDFELFLIGATNGSVTGVTGSGTTYTVTTTNLTGNGIHRLDVKSSGTGIVNALGNPLSGGFTGGQTYAVDRDVPPAPSAPDLLAGNDSGSSSTDNITSITALTFTGTGAEFNALVRIYANGTEIGSANANGTGVWSVTCSALTEGTYTITAKVQDAAGNLSNASTGLSVTVDTSAPSAPVVVTPANGAATFSTTPLISGTAGTGDIISITIDGSTIANVTTAGISGSWTYTPSTLTIGTHTVRAHGLDLAGNSSPQSNTNTFTIAPIPTIVVNPATIPDATVGAAYNQTFTGSGGTAPYTFEIVSGAIPGGLAFNTATGALSGIPTAAGNFNFTIKTTDASVGGSYSGTRAYTLVVNPPVILITPATLPNATVAAAYSQTISASGGIAPYSYTVTAGALPAGLTLSSTGVLSGTSTAGGTFNFTVTAKGSSTGTGSPHTGSKAYVLVVAAPTIAVNPTALPAPTTGMAYSQAITASGGTAPYSYAITAGALPAGLTLSNTGTLSGTSTAAGTFNFTVTATDVSGGAGPYTGLQGYSFTAGVPTVLLPATSLPNGDVEVAYSKTINPASGGTSPYSYAITTGSLPEGIILSSTGTLSGTPLENGTFNFAIKATDASTGTGAPFSSAPRGYTLTIVGKRAQSITLAATGTAQYGGADIDLGATASSGLVVTYTSGDEGIATIVNGKVHILAAGMVTIYANQSGNTAYHAALQVQQVLTINKLPLTITANNRSKTYGDAVTFAGTDFTNTGLINGNTITGVTLTSTGAGATATVTGSTYPIIVSAATGTGLANYNISYNNGTLTVNRKALTITADSKEKFEGRANPALTASYSGFVNNESAVILTTQPVLATTATLNSPVGDYPITASGAVAANYTFTYVAGKLKIKPGAPTIITLAGVTLYENSPAITNAGTLSSTSDDPSATFTYTLVAGTGDTDNSSFAIAGNKINTTAALNFENKSSYSVRVRSTTQYGLFLDKVLNITLSDVNEIPTLAAISNQTICFTTTAQTVALSGITAGPEAGQIINLTVSSNNAALFETLNVTGSGATATLSYRIKAGAIAGTATVTVTVKDNGGTANGGVDTYSRNFVITINALPVVSINSDKGLEISKGERVLLSATGGTSYAWLAHSSIKGSLNSATIEVRPRETTTYTLTVTNASGCSETKTFTLTVLDDYMKVKANNILSPNNDGYNDKWLVDNIDFYPNNELKIFDKAGRLIYGKRGYDNSWDGTFNGTALAEGTYYYIIDFGTRQRVFKGFITIVRND